MQSAHLEFVSMLNDVIKVHVPSFLHARQSIAVLAEFEDVVHTQ